MKILPSIVIYILGTMASATALQLLAIAQTIGADETAIARSPRGPGLTHGPFIGHVSPTTARVWARCISDGPYVCSLVDPESGTQFSSTQTAQAESDHCVSWSFDELVPGNRYQYTIKCQDAFVSGGPEYTLQTAPIEDQPSVTTLAFGSCAREDAGTATVWRRWQEIEPAAVVLLGDTPYIDSTDLAVQRRRYRDFASAANMQRLLRNTSWYGTWDDHDFGRNDTDGRMPGKERSRRAFSEYHANPSYGTGTAGVFTSFRRGGVEVFLLDTRYFASTEPSPADPEKPTLLGRQQWQWLKHRLEQSTAPLKVLASGMIWNGATRPNKPDHWMAYPHEREALFRFVGKAKITGVVLVGGDIHRSRVLRHPTKETVGYDLVEFITSPMHDGIIAAANAPHPALLFDAGEPHAFLLLTADTTTDPPMVTGQLQNAAGKVLFEIRLSERQLSPR